MKADTNIKTNHIDEKQSFADVNLGALPITKDSERLEEPIDDTLIQAICFGFKEEKGRDNQRETF